MDEFVMDIKWGQIWGGVAHSYKIANNISSKVFYSEKKWKKKIQQLTEPALMKVYLDELVI